MEQYVVNPETAMDKIIESFNNFDKARLQELEKTKQLQNASIAVYEKERTRMLRKYGDIHPTIKKIDARLVNTQKVSTALDIVIDFSKVQAPQPNPGSWQIYGRVLNKSIKGVKGLTLSLFDAKGEWIRELGFVTTDHLGFFSIAVEDKDSKLREKYKDQNLYLTVTNDQRKVLHREKTPMQIAVGTNTQRLILLNEETIFGTPPV